MLIHYRDNPVMHWYSIQGGIEIFLVISCYRNRSDGHWLVLSYKFKVGYKNAFHRHKVMMLSNCHCGLLFAFKAVQMFISCCLHHFCRWGSWAWCVFCQRCFLIQFGMQGIQVEIASCTLPGSWSVNIAQDTSLWLYLRLRTLPD